MAEVEEIEIIATVGDKLPEVFNESENILVVKGSKFLHIHGTVNLMLSEVNEIIKNYFPELDAKSDETGR